MFRDTFTSGVQHNHQVRNIPPLWRLCSLHLDWFHSSLLLASEVKFREPCPSSLVKETSSLVKDPHWLRTSLQCLVSFAKVRTPIIIWDQFRLQGSVCLVSFHLLCSLHLDWLVSHPRHTEVFGTIGSV